MCYLIRQAQSEAERGSTTPLPSMQSPRPRWAAGIAATLIGGLAVAALVVPPPAAPLMKAKEAAAPAPIASQTPAVPTPAVLERTTIGGDDGVPSASEVGKAGMSHCEYAL